MRRGFDISRCGSIVVFGLPLLAAPAVLIAAGTTFVYQGQLKQQGRSLDRVCAFEFTLWRDAVSAKPQDQIGGKLVHDGRDGRAPMVPIQDGTFVVSLDFGEEAFSGDTRWLQVAVRCPEDRRMTALTPRIPIKPVREKIKEAEPEPPPATAPASQPSIEITGIPVTMPADCGNTAAGLYATVVGGRDNEAAGAYSFAAGRGARISADHLGAFVWADSNGNSEEPKPFEATANDQFLIRAGGGVGIGTNAPQAALDVAGEIRTAGIRTAAQGPFTALAHGTAPTGAPTADGFRLRYHDSYFSGGADALIVEKTDGTVPNSDSGVVFMNTGADGEEKVAMVVKGNGRVGIGTLRPDAALHVCGDLRVAGAVLTDVSVNCPDYVFAPDYPLPPLEQVRDHIRREKHLPGVPKAAEMERHGIDVARFQMKLLEKIEELTLYSIQQQEEIAAKDCRMESIEQQNRALEARLARLENMLTR